MSKNNFIIKWNKINKRTFMYGTKIIFKDQYTLVNNPLMPSGIVITDWKMLSKYNEDRHVPSLPMLSKCKRYKLIFDYEVKPLNSIYFKITLYNRNDEILSERIVETKSCILTYTNDSYSYKLEMINAGLQELIFKKIIIHPIDESYNTIYNLTTINSVFKEKFNNL
ncbi:accessory secretory protein Asp3 [Staphylococcus simulans]|uniref:accessory Sec system protein Asp3 n=1 Tax=Staphylococcus simulans TaxID=1286 RepID=UPI0030BA57EB